jgi:uncharacterized protein YndB with AHSA1/START domain
MATNTICLHRVLRTSPDRLYRAFVEPSAFERWLPPFGFTGKVHSMEPVAGGAWRMSFTNFGTGHSHSARIGQRPQPRALGRVVGDPPP